MVACKVAGTLISPTSRPTRVGAGPATKDATFGEVAHDLLGEERIAARARGDRRRKLAHRRMLAQQLCASVADSGLLSGASVSVCAPGTRVSAP